MGEDKKKKPYDVTGAFQEVARRAKADQEAAAARRRPNPAQTPPPRVEAADGRVPDLPPTPASIRPHAPPRAPDRSEALRRLMASLTR